MPKPIDKLGMGPVYRIGITKDNKGVIRRVTVTVTAPLFMETPTVQVILTPDQYERFQQWQRGEGLIQNLLPDLSPSDREKLMTGLDDDAFFKATREE